MCGVAGGLHLPDGRLDRACAALEHRGPDAAGQHDDGAATLGHTRLAVRDLDPRSDQPYRIDGTAVAYNGELWNADEVRARLEVQYGHCFTTTGDTEVIAAALHYLDADALPLLDGMWAVAWTRDGRLRLATDRYGETPLHASRLARGGFAFASELKGLAELTGGNLTGARHVEPGCVVTVEDGRTPQTTRWFTSTPEAQHTDLDGAAKELRRLLEDAVQVRTVADVPIAALLSGGLDSAVTLALARQHLPDIVAYTAVHDPASPDRKAAHTVAAHLDVPLIEVPVPAPSADDLSATVAAVEQPNKAQVEIGWACLYLARRLRSDGVKVVYSGEGSDELWASYGFSHHGIVKDGWYEHRRRLFYDQHRKNFARVNKVFLAAGVEPRMPFLHDALVRYALSLPQSAVRDGSRPKAVLERAAADLLPRQIVRRPKLAFQDAAGLKAAAARAVPDPGRFYRAEFARLYR